MCPDSEGVVALDEGTVEALAAHQERQRAAAAEHPTVWRALAGGVDLKLVSGILRHSSITITADTYTSVLPETALAAAEGVAAMRRDRPARPALTTAPGGHGHVKFRYPHDR